MKMKKREIKQIISNVLQNIGVDQYAVCLDKEKTKFLVDWLGSKSFKPLQFENVLTAYILQNADLVCTIENCDNNTFTYNTLKYYRRKINLNGIKADLKYTYGKQVGGIFMNWHNKKASTPDVVALELKDCGVQIESTNEFDIFKEILDTYNNSKNNLKEKYISISIRCKQDEVRKNDLEEQIRYQCKNFLQLEQIM